MSLKRKNGQWHVNDLRVHSISLIPAFFISFVANRMTAQSRALHVEWSSWTRNSAQRTIGWRGWRWNWQKWRASSEDSRSLSTRMCIGKSSKRRKAKPRSTERAESSPEGKRSKTTKIMPNHRSRSQKFAPFSKSQWSWIEIFVYIFLCTLFEKNTPTPNQSTLCNFIYVS